MIDYSRLANTMYTHDRIRRVSVVVVGAGALGNEVIKALGLLGVAELTVVDPDVVEPSNLTRSVLFRTGNCKGRNKAEVIASAAQGIFPDTRFRAFPMEIADVGLRQLARANLMFGCVDSDLARLEIAYLCTKLDLPFCDGGLGSGNYSQGRVTWFAGKSGACFSCMLPAQRRRQLLTTWDPITTRCVDSQNTQAIPSTPTMAGIVGSLQVDFALKNYLTGIAKSATVEIDLDGLTRLERFSLEQSVHCPFHWKLSHEEQIHPVPPLETSIGEWLCHLNARPSARPFLYLDWPICTRAQCLCCRLSWMPMARAAVIRRIVCPNCGSDAILALEYIRNIGQDSEWAACSFVDLHLPHDHLLTARFIPEENAD